VWVGAALDARAGDHRSVCGSEAVVAGVAAQVTDARSFVLDDGREVRLASLEVPTADGGSAAGEMARTALAATLKGHTIRLRLAEAAPDRYGRLVAYAFTAGDGGRRSVAGALLVTGFARVGDPVGDAACVRELLGYERVARAAKMGLWGEAQYAIIPAGDLEGLLARQGRFAVVEGKVASVRERAGITYVNFGRRWSQALTVTISKRQERIFSSAGLRPDALENRRLRVRGWVEVRNGPRIEAARPEQIELIEAN
jgi:endonuclease YncB( thermonuclease family)